MPTFSYSGQLRSTNAISGTLDATTAEAAMAELQAAGIRVTSIAPAAAMVPVRPLSRDDFLYFNQQLASLAETGVALDKGLRILAKDLRRGRLRRAVEDIADDLERGIPLADAVDRRANLFPPLYAEILKSGVENNRLGTTLCNLNTHLLVMQDSRRMFWESVTYPLIVLILGFAVLSVFMVYVVPQQEELVFGVEGTLVGSFGHRATPPLAVPAPTQVLFDVAHHWGEVMKVAGGAVVGLLVLAYLLKLFPVGRRIREGVVSAIPGFRGVHKASLLAQFSQAAALGASAGHDLPRVLRLASGATGNHELIGEAEQLSKQIEGGMMPGTTGGGRIIPAIFGHIAQFAGCRGQLAPALAEMARAYEAIARHRMTMLRVVLAPILILLLAFVLGFAISAMFLPLVSVINGLTSSD
jgi:type IV pilus assembly protein PilC